MSFHIEGQKYACDVMDLFEPARSATSPEGVPATHTHRRRTNDL